MYMLLVSCSLLADEPLSWTPISDGMCYYQIKIYFNDASLFIMLELNLAFTTMSLSITNLLS